MKLKRTSLTLAFLSAFFMFHAAYAQWSGTNPLYTFYNIGLGISSPSYPLHIRLDATGAPLAPPTAPLLQTEYVNPLGTLVNSSIFSVYNNGNVAIGTNSAPLAKLHVVGTQYIDGDLGIGTASPASGMKLHLYGGSQKIENGDLLIADASNYVNIKLYKDGLIWAREFKVKGGAIPDYVFDPSYKRMSLYELEKYVNTYHHLPGIPSEAEYKAAGGVNMGELQLKLLEKVEELTLYTIDLKKENDKLKADIELLKKK